MLVGGRMLRLGSHFISPRVVILAYHSIQERPELFANSIGLGITHSVSTFESQMELIARQYTPVSLEEIRLIVEGEKHLSKHAVAVTFDDGYRDNCEIAEPILRRYGIPAIFYLTVSSVGASEAPWFCRLRHAFATTGRNEWLDPVQGQRLKLSDPKSRTAALQAAFDIAASMDGETCRATVRTIEQDLDVVPLTGKNLMMTWDQVRRLQHSGHLVGSHTLTHPNLAHVKNMEIVRSELVGSKIRIERELKRAVQHFSYPHPALNPQWTDLTVAITHEAGYRTAVTTAAGPIRSDSNPLLMTRMIVPRDENQFQLNLQRTFLKRGSISRSF
jgi:peptidoglycan/xylan/chitin deacetylase (PgdA/CDA1 family)